MTSNSIDGGKGTATYIQRHRIVESNGRRLINVSEEVSSFRPSCENEASTLLSWDHVPHWQQDNEYLLSAYRAPSGSYRKSLLSIFTLHNETVNIHSHALGALLFSTLPFIVYKDLQDRFVTASTSDIIGLSTFFFGVATCFLLSAIFHILNNHSPLVASVCSRLDHLGIVILMWGSTIPSVYYGFYCSPSLQRLYWAQVSVLAIGCTVVTLQKNFRTRTWRPFRSAMYAGLGLSFVVPIVHSVMKFGREIQMWRMSLDWMFLMGILNLVGAVVYAWRVPEKWYPYTFDLFGSSHQILHFAVIFAGVAHMFGLLRAYDHVHSVAHVCGSTRVDRS